MSSDYQPWDGFPKCPCPVPDCFGQKLAKKSGHVVGCSNKCVPCRNRRNKTRGQANQRKGHRALGGEGTTPSNEEAVGGYPIVCQVEHKDLGPSVPVGFMQFIGTDWFRRALSQAERARRVGDGSMPAVMLDGRWLIVDCKKNQDGAA